LWAESLFFDSALSTMSAMDLNISAALIAGSWYRVFMRFLLPDKVVNAVCI